MCVWHSGDMPRSTKVFRKGAPQNRQGAPEVMACGDTVCCISLSHMRSQGSRQHAGRGQALFTPEAARVARGVQAIGHGDGKFLLQACGSSGQPDAPGGNRTMLPRRAPRPMLEKVVLCPECVEVSVMEERLSPSDLQSDRASSC